MRIRSKMGDSVAAVLSAREAGRGGVLVGGVVHTVARRRGRILWEDTSHNLIVNTGLVYTHGVTLLGVAQIATWYIGLIGAAATLVAGDTSATHAGWTEVTTYAEAVRQTWLGVAGATGTSSNTASPAAFSINGSTTVGGVFLISVNTKGGVTGTLYSEVKFTGGDRALVNTDTLSITYNQSSSDDGI